MRPPPESLRAAPRDPAWTRPFVWCGRCSTKLFVGEARCCRCGTERVGTFPVVEAGVGIAGRSNAVSNRAGSSPVGGERYYRERCLDARSFVDAARRCESWAYDWFFEGDDEAGAGWVLTAQEKWRGAAIALIRLLITEAA